MLIKYTLLYFVIPKSKNKMAAENTTIKLSKETKERLDNLKEYKRESYEEILQKMLETLTLCRINPEAARGKLISIDRQRRSLMPQQKRAKSSSQAF